MTAVATAAILHIAQFVHVLLHKVFGAFGPPHAPAHQLPCKWLVRDNNNNASSHRNAHHRSTVALSAVPCHNTATATPQPVPRSRTFPVWVIATSPTCTATRGRSRAMARF